jgi:hypothetical protein
MLKIQRRLRAKVGSGYQDPITKWYKLLNNYSCRSITFDADRLLAVLGLAKEVSNTSKNGLGQTLRYYAGIWESDFHRGLIWRSPSPNSFRFVSDESYIAPSWSWASIKLGWPSGPSLYDELYHESHEEDDTQLLEVAVKNLNNDPFSKAIGGFIRISARCQEITHQLQLDSDLVRYNDPRDETDFRKSIPLFSW